MMRIVSLFLLFFGTLSACAQKNSSVTTLRVAIMRHAEKPKSGNNLSCAGLNRSLALPSVLDTLIGIADHIYIPEVNTGKKTSSARMFQTVSPYAIKHNLSINSKYKVNDSIKLVKDILTKKGTILIVWDHTHIPSIARMLGISTASEWASKEYDSVWIIELSVDENGTILNSAMVEKKQQLHPSEKCH